MTIFEAGGLSGVPAGAIVGGMTLKSYGLPGILGGLVAGIVLGFVAGALYGVLVLSLLHYFHRGWCAAKSQPEAEVDSPAWKAARRVAKQGVPIGVFGALLGWMTYGWMLAVPIAITVALTTAAKAGFRSGAA